MYDSKKSMNKRIAAGIMVLLMLVAMLFSAFYIAAEADHECMGEDCPICACIQQCENTLHHFGDRLAVQVAIIVPVIFILISAILLSVDFAQETPISKKVRLNN